MRLHTQAGGNEDHQVQQQHQRDAQHHGKALTGLLAPAHLVQEGPGGSIDHGQARALARLKDETVVFYLVGYGESLVLHWPMISVPAPTFDE
jgi:hypothetical protein